jgi:hypothetical protein
VGCNRSARRRCGGECLISPTAAGTVNTRGGIIADIPRDTLRLAPCFWCWKGAGSRQPRRLQVAYRHQCRKARLLAEQLAATKSSFRSTCWPPRRCRGQGISGCAAAAVCDKTRSPRSRKRVLEQRMADPSVAASTITSALQRIGLSRRN